MDFLDLIAGLGLDRLEHAMAASTDADVDRALLRNGIDDRDIAALLSPAAARRLEESPTTRQARRYRLGARGINAFVKQRRLCPVAR